MISKRLKAIALNVSDGSYIMDVGCDHALLDIYLALEKNCKCIASDINEKPLEKAKENIKLYNLEDKIKVLLSDGIKDIEKYIDTVILSGLGTDTILDILFKDKDKLSNVNHIIISTQSKYYKLRKEMSLNGFVINNELFIKDKGKYYLIIDFIKGSRKYSKKELEYGPILINSNNDVYKEYLLKIVSKLECVNEKIRFRHIVLYFKNKKKIREIKSIL